MVLLPDRPLVTCHVLSLDHKGDISCLASITRNK